MLRISRLLMTLPVLALPLAAMAAKPAHAALSAEQGLTILAKAQVADGRCNVLSKAEHRELSTYRSRAEIASAGLISAKKAAAAIAKGKAQGKSAPCNDATRSDIRETLIAARQAVAEADGAMPRPEKPEVIVDPVEKMLPKGKAKALALPEYRELIMPYFVDLRCKQLGGRKARNYYEAIKGLQAAMIRQHGTPAVASAQSRAQREARGVNCGAVSLRMAQSGYAAIMGK